ncbi:tRNA (guanosine(37)-N1)-methyltransferase TrmD [Rhodovibrionaceae bacterium A322]
MSPPQPWHATLVTLFPEAFPGPMGLSLAGKALDKGLWSMECVNIRDFATDRHHTVDDTPAGGGAGMVMKPDVVDAALLNVADKPGPLLFMSPRGRLLDSGLARELAAEPGVRLLCGRYEGIDQRVLDKHQPIEVSIGDFVLSGGEMAALVVLDAIVRLLPGVMGNDQSSGEESFEQNLLEYSQYTRPAEWEGRKIPEVLLSGHHEKIRQWRHAQAETITKERRPDLWERYLENRKER